MNTFYEHITNIFKYNIISNIMLINKKNSSKCTKKQYKYYVRLIKQYKLLGILPFKKHSIIKLKKNNAV